MNFKISCHIVIFSLSNESSTSCSGIISPTTDITGLHLPSLSQSETISISVSTTTTATNNDQSMILANQILKNMIKNTECARNDESLLKTVKSVNFDSVDIAPCITNSKVVIFISFS